MAIAGHTKTEATFCSLLCGTKKGAVYIVST